MIAKLNDAAKFLINVFLKAVSETERSSTEVSIANSKLGNLINLRNDILSPIAKPIDVNKFFLQVESQVQNRLSVLQTLSQANTNVIRQKIGPGL